MLRLGNDGRDGNERDSEIDGIGSDNVGKDGIVNPGSVGKAGNVGKVGNAMPKLIDGMGSESVGRLGSVSPGRVGRLGSVGNEGKDRLRLIEGIGRLSTGIGGKVHLLMSSTPSRTGKVRCQALVVVSLEVSCQVQHGCEQQTP